MKKIVTLILLVVGFVGQVNATMYIVGSTSDLGSWDYANPKTMTEASDGTYYYTFKASAGGDLYFNFSTAKGSSDIYQGSSYKPDSDTTIGIGHYSTVTVTNFYYGSFKVTLDANTEYIIGFEPTAPRVAVVPKTDALYALGGIHVNSDNNWVPNNGVEMTKTNDYVFVCDFEIADGHDNKKKFGFTTKLGANDSDWSINSDQFGAGSSNGNYEITTFPNTGIGLGWGNDDNHTFFMKNQTAGKYKFVLDYKLLKLAVYQTESVTTNAYGYSTYVNTSPLNTSYTINAKTYYATDRNNGSATAHVITDPAASTPMLIKGNSESAVTYYFAKLSSGGTNYTGSPYNNVFHAGSDAAVSSYDNESTGPFRYILQGNKFMAANDQTVGANKAYLQLSAKANTARPLIFPEDDDTGISEIEAMRNVGNEKFYNLNGQRIANPTKGLYIVNGKKVVVR